MAIQVFRPYFFTKDTHLKLIPLNMKVFPGTSTIATSFTNDIEHSLQSYSFRNLTKNGDVLHTIIDMLESFTQDQSVKELKAIEDEIKSVLFTHWREELLHYVKVIEEALTVPNRIEELNEVAVNSSQENYSSLNNQLKSIEKSLLNYPFDNKKELTEELSRIKSQFICDKEVQSLEEAIIRLEEKVNEESFNIDAYREMKSDQSKIEVFFVNTLQTEPVIVLQKRFNQIKQSISMCKSKLYSCLRGAIDEVEVMEILELLAVQPSNLITNRKRLSESVMAIPKGNLQTNSAVEEAIQKTAALCLIQEANTEQNLIQGLMYLEWEDFINLGREGCSRVVTYFWKDQRESLSLTKTEEELRNSINPYIERLHREIHAVNEATTIESMLIALSTLDIYNGAQQTEKELMNGANYIFILQETETFHSINRIRQAFTMGMNSVEKVASSNGLSVYMSENSLASNLQLQTSGTDSNEIKIPIVMNNINSGSTETITLLK